MVLKTRIFLKHISPLNIRTNINKRVKTSTADTLSLKPLYRIYHEKI
ncbi:hypothetical protein POTTS_236 [Klebsiella phage vB_KpnM_Potts1]|uniref:Uncharacterized protein n=1 Tax=Klebsiella phage vB_KpnM_Potts1 TaxID=2591366 RepID=A0A5B9NJ28_9CAUD|nr:hypothetical protein POTTS_236 [Klebsiella phage vB_KpnM_Potts1]